MKRLHQFVLKSFLGPFFMTFLICVFVLLMQFLWKYIDDLVGKGLEWNVVLELLYYASLALFPMAFPLAMLLASIMSFGNLGENYELIAMKASGISLIRIMRPLLLLAVFLCCFAFYFQNNILPRTNLKFGALMVSVKRQKPEMIIKEGVFTNDIDGYSIKVDRKSKTSKMMYKILIYDHTEKRGNVSVTIADSGYMNISKDKKFMVMTLYHGGSDIDQKTRGEAVKRHPFQRTSFDKETITVPLRGFDFKKTNENSLRNAYHMMNLSQLTHFRDSLTFRYKYKIRSFALRLKYNEVLEKSITGLSQPVDSQKTYESVAFRKSADYNTFYNKLNDIEKEKVLASASKKIKRNKQLIDQNTAELYGMKKGINKYAMEKYKKFTWSFACVIFFFIGAPLGAIIRKGGLGMPVVISILMFILYYMVSMFGEKFAREDIWDMFNGMWFSTFIFFPLGIFLTYKSAHDSGILNLEVYQEKFKKIIKFISFNTRFLKKNSHENSSTNE